METHSSPSLTAFTLFNRLFSLQGRRALVTGAGRGIGRTIAETLAGAGAEVMVHFNASAAAAEEVVGNIRKQGGQAWSVGADLTDSAAVGRLFQTVKQRWPALDILVNNAGDLVKRCNVADADDELIDRVMRVNVHSALYVSRAAIPLLAKGQNPIILNLSSVAAHNGGAGGATIYASAKGAVHTFTRGLAKELAPKIRVNGIAPGVIHTDFHRIHSGEERLRGIAQATPLQRVGQADDCAAAAIFLCGDGASFITGEIIEINGGLWVA